MRLKIIRTNKEILTKLSSNNNNQNLIFVSKLKIMTYFKIIYGNWKHSRSGNLGTIIRTLDAFCVNTCILVDNCVDQYSRDVDRFDSFSLKIVNCSSKSLLQVSYNLVVFCDWYKCKTNY